LTTPDRSAPQAVDILELWLPFDNLNDDFGQVFGASVHAANLLSYSSEHLLVPRIVHRLSMEYSRPSL
jgi:hypothetical protein